MKTYVLAADVGGTKIDIGLFEAGALGAPPTLAREALLPSRTFATFGAALDSFLKGEPIAAAAFGLPGPVIDDAVVTTNLPWRVNGHELRGRLGTDRVRLMNDLETTAFGALHLPQSSFKTLNEGKVRKGHVGVIAAGTGLGQAYLFWDGAGYRTAGTEGGHVDFAPRDELDVELLGWLKRKFGRVSWERVVSGPGLVDMFTFLADEKRRDANPRIREEVATAEDKAAVIGRAGVEGSCRACEEAVEMFIRAYGAQAGNLALTVMATGGVFIGGGIVTKLLPKIGSSFVQAFRAKGRYEPFMGELPVKVILDPRTSRLGAAMSAAALL